MRARECIEEETPLKLRIVGGLTLAINSAIETKRKALTTPFLKHLAIANTNNGEEFLLEVRCNLHLCHFKTYMTAYFRFSCYLYQ